MEFGKGRSKQKYQWFERVNRITGIIYCRPAKTKILTQNFTVQ